MRRRGLIIGLALALLVLHLVADGVGSSYVLARHVAPGDALERGAERLAVSPPAGVAPPVPGSAVPLTVRGISYGYAVDYAIPGGGTVSCSHRGPWSWCSDGWHMVRAPRPGRARRIVAAPGRLAARAGGGSGL